MKETVKLGYIGLGMRGRGVLKHCIAQMTDVDVAYLCDLSPERLEKGKQICLEQGKPAPVLTKDYHDILNDPPWMP